MMPLSTTIVWPVMHRLSSPAGHDGIVGSRAGGGRRLIDGLIACRAPLTRR
jgi:hypothetical protein